MIRSILAFPCDEMCTLSETYPSSHVLREQDSLRWPFDPLYLTSLDIRMARERSSVLREKERCFCRKGGGLALVDSSESLVEFIIRIWAVGKRMIKTRFETGIYLKTSIRLKTTY